MLYLKKEKLVLFLIYRTSRVYLTQHYLYFLPTTLLAKTYELRILEPSKTFKNR